MDMSEILRWANTLANYCTAGLLFWVGMQFRKSSQSSPKVETKKDENSDSE